jgi:hypothetical protein
LNTIFSLISDERAVSLFEEIIAFLCDNFKTLKVFFEGVLIMHFEDDFKG